MKDVLCLKRRGIREKSPWFILFLVVATMFLPGCGNDGGVEVAERYDYYEIRGNSEAELRAEINEKGVQWEDGKKYASSTAWHVTWSHNTACTSSGCTATGFTVRVEIATYLPKWLPVADVPQGLQARWESYLENLMTHEKGHRDMAVDAAFELERAVSLLPPAAGRSALQKAVDTVAGELLEKLTADSKQYDNATLHGYTQGAAFP